MKTYTIKQKMSNTGSIYDIASDMYDREIKFRKGTRYAVVLASYLGDHYTTHKTEAAAARQSRREKRAHTIIDVEGNSYEAINEDGLYRLY